MPIDPTDENVVLTPNGGRVRRCKAKCKKRGDRCQRSVASGTAVCIMHGAGIRKRVVAGTRVSPLTAAITRGSGPRKPPDDRQTEELRKSDPLFRERLDYYRGKANLLLSHHEMLARLWALADCLEERVRSIGLDGGGENPPPLLAALSVIRASLETVAKIEGRIDESTHVEVTVFNGYIAATVDLLVEFVSADRLDAALAKLRGLEVKR